MIPRNSKVFKDERAMMSGGMGLSAIMAAANATKSVVSSGDWSSGATWSGGTVPVAGDNIHIPSGKRVTYDLTSSPDFGWIRNEGSFKFDTTKATVLNCHTILNTLTSYLEIGNPAHPATADIEFVAGAVLTGDTSEMSKGLLTIGRVMIYGEWRIPYAKLPQTVAVGATSVTLPDQYDPQTGTLRDTGAAVAATWKVGDILNFPKNKASGSGKDEGRTITAISGATVTFTPALDFDHSGPAGDPHLVGEGNRQTANGMIHRHQSYVINETKSIVFKSRVQFPVAERGHLMFMHGRQVRNTNKIHRREDHIFVPTIAEMGDNADPGICIENMAYIDLGRSETRATPAIGEAGNQVGRYGAHLHGAGHWSQNPIRFRGNHGQGNVGWMCVRHDSHVHIDYCTARGDNGEDANPARDTTITSYGGGGALFVDENDTELGFWTRCLGYACYGRSDRPAESPDRNNELSFNGHAHKGDAFAVNRQASVRELIAINTRALLHIHPPKTNSRRQINSMHSTGVPTDRRPDIEGIKRTSFLGNPVAYHWYEDSNPGGWFACEGQNSGDGLFVFHRQRAYYGYDFHTLIENWTLTNCGGRQIRTENYTHNYMIKGCSFLDGNYMWRYGDKSWGFVWIQNYADRMSATLFIDNWGRNDETYNIQGGFADNEWGTVGTWPTGTGAAGEVAFDHTNYDSSTFPAYTWGVNWLEAPYLGATDTIKAEITDGFKGNVPLYLGTLDDGWEGIVNNAGPRRMGYGRRGITDRRINTVIHAPGADTDRGYVLTPEEMVYTHGCVPFGTNQHYVPLYFPLRDRVNGTLHFARTEYNVDHLPLAYRQKYEIAVDPGEPSTAKLVPTVLATQAVTTYAAFPDPDSAIHYIIIDGKLIVDSSEADLGLAEGATRTFTRTFTFAGGGTQTFDFTVTGRAKAPANFYEGPTITRQGAFHSAVQRGADEFVPTTLEFEKGKADGWPQPWALADMKHSTDAKATWPSHANDIGIHDHAFTFPNSWRGDGGGIPVGPDVPIEGHYRMVVTYENDLGSISATSNTLEITASGGFTAGETRDVAAPATITDAEP